MTQTETRAEDLRIHRRSGPMILNAIIAVVALVVVAIAVQVFIGTGRIRWDIVWNTMWSPALFNGVGTTLMLTGVSLVGSIILGTILAAMLISNNIVLKFIASSYIWFFRGTPLLVQIVFWFNLGLFLPMIELPWTAINTNAIITPTTAALLGLLLNVSAFMCEVIRGGLISVDKGQTEAALSIGMTPVQALLQIILPQAVRVILPTAGNLAIDLLKTTSLVYVIGTREIMGTTQSIAAQTFYVIEMLVVASLWYLILVTIATLLQAQLEKRLARSQGSTPVQTGKVL